MATSKKKKESNGKAINRGIRICTPPITIEIQSSDEKDSLEVLKDMAEAIIRKYGEDKHDRHQ